MTTNDRLTDELVALMASRDSKESANVLAREVQSSRATLAAIEALPTDAPDDSEIPIWYNADEARGYQSGYQSGYIAAMQTVKALLHPNPEEDR